MPGLAGRTATLIKAKLSKLLDRAEDPAETLDYAYERQLEDLQNVKRGIADVVTAKKRLQLQEATFKQQTDKLDGQAREAMAAGREDLSRAALERKQLISSEVSSLDAQVAELESEQQKLTDAEAGLRDKIEAFRTKNSAAEARVRISDAATGIGDDMADIGLAMQRAVEKTGDMKARASAVEELQAAGTLDDITALGPPQDDIDRQLAQLGNASSVDDEFNKLKAELGPGSSKPPQSASDTDATP
jgi:phage shock protein A